MMTLKQELYNPCTDDAAKVWIKHKKLVWSICRIIGLKLKIIGTAKIWRKKVELHCGYHFWRNFGRVINGGIIERECICERVDFLIWCKKSTAIFALNPHGYQSRAEPVTSSKVARRARDELCAASSRARYSSPRGREHLVTSSRFLEGMIGERAVMATVLLIITSSTNWKSM